MVSYQYMGYFYQKIPKKRAEYRGTKLRVCDKAKNYAANGTSSPK